MHRQTVIGSVKEIWAYRVFLKYETLGKLKIRHKGTYLGFLWWVLDPLIFLGIFYFVFGIVFQRGDEHYPVFLFCALLPWRWFVTGVSESCVSIRSSGNLLKQVYFPKLIIPLTAVFTNTVSFFYGLLVLAAILAVFQIVPGWNLAWLPLVLLVQFAFTIGLGLVLADLNIFMKDTEVLIRHVLQIWFYASPGIYSMEMIPARYRDVLMMNPFAVLFTSYRDTLMYDRRPDVLALGAILLLAVALIVLGIRLMARHQGQYAKIL